MPRRTARTYANGGSTSRRPRRCSPGTTLSRMLIMLQAACRHTLVKSSKPSSQTPTAPRNLRGPGRTSPPQRCSYATCPSMQTLSSRSSTATSGCWWSTLPYSRWKAPRHATSTWPPAQSEGQACCSKTPQSTSGKGFHRKYVGHDTAAATRPDPAPAAWRPPVRGQLGHNYGACSVIHSRQLARRGGDVDRAAVDAAEAH
jgi:hypothetical protein